LISNGTTNQAVAQSGFTYNTTNKSFSYTGTTYYSTGGVNGLSSTLGEVVLSVPIEADDRTIFIDYYIYETTLYYTRGGTLTVLPYLDGSSYWVYDGGIGSTDVTIYADLSNSIVSVYYAVSFGTWDFSFSTRVLKGPISQPTYYGLSSYGGSPLITHYTASVVPYGSCFCSSGTVYESFGPITSIVGLTPVTGTVMGDCLDPCF
jgi:hypothetical protein